MILFSNNYTGNIDKDYTNNIPIEVTTDIWLMAGEETDVIEQATDVNGNFLYKDSDNMTTTESSHYYKNESITTDKLNYIGCSKCDTFYNTIEVKNKIIYEKQKLYKKIKVTEDNAHLFNIDDIIEQECLNILNSTDMNRLLFNILENLVYSKSTFKLYNKYRCTLAPGNNIELIIQINRKIDILKLMHVPKTATLYINDKVVEFNDPEDINFSIGANVSDLKIDISNNTDKDIHIINPLLLY